MNHRQNIEQLNNEDETLKEIEKEYYEKELSKVKESEIDFIKEIVKEDPDWVKERCLEFLEGKLKRINKDILRWIEQANNYEGWFSVSIYKACVVPLFKEWERVYREVNMYKNPKFVENSGKISDEMIQRAKEYPIGNLLEINKAGFATCINHDDKKPSMYTKNNYAYCFSCGYHADTIGVIMKLHNLDFVSAVKFINNN